MENVKELQNAIRHQLKAKGMSQIELARRVYCVDHEEDHADDSDAGMNAFAEAFKKQLRRPTTPLEKLSRYLDILQQDQFGVEARYQCIASDHLTAPMREHMRNLSESIDVLLAKK